MGGVGKTQIAAMFAKSNQNEFTKIYWVNGSNLCKSLAEILFSFGQILPKDPSIEMLSHMILRMLCGKEEKVLFVLDDVTDAERKEVSAFKRISQGRLSLLVTSQTSDLDSSDITLIKILCFEEEEATKFLQNELQESSKDIDLLAARLHSFPLALQQAVCYIRKFKLPVFTYIEQFEACRQSILNVKIGSFSEYDKTLLTVWDMAFDKIKKESNNALLVLGMMAYMDNRFVNQKTFLHCPDIDGEIELNEILELLCQYSLVMRRHHDYLEIHGLIQKVVRFHIQNNRFVDGSNPRESLTSLLTSFLSSVDSDDISYNDNENLWFAHLIKLMEIVDEVLVIDINVMLLTIIAKRRHDTESLFGICNIFTPFLLEKYRRTRNFDDFLLLIDVHRLFFTVFIIDDLLTARMIEFEQEFAKELESEHSSIFIWKVQIIIFLKNNKNYQRAEAISSELFKQLINKKGFEDVKLELCGLLSSLDRETLLKQINEHHLESHSSKLKYYSIRYSLYLKNRNFDESKKWLTKFEQECRKYDFSYYEPHFVLRKVWLLYWKSQFNDVLELLEKWDEWKRLLFGVFYLFKSLLLLKLGKYNEAESVYDDKNDFDVLQSLSLSFVKFMKNDFSGAKEILESWKINDDINNILDYVCLYKMKWYDFNQKKNSSSLNQRHEVAKSLKECVEMKEAIIEMYDNYFRYRFFFL